MVTTTTYSIIQDIISGARFMGILMMGYAVFRLLLTLSSTSLQREYKVPGWLFILACAALGLQTLAQFVGHIRETNLALAWGVNLVAYIVVVPAFDLAVMYFLRGGKGMRTPLAYSLATAGVNLVLLSCGMLFPATPFGPLAPVVAAVLLTIFEVVMFGWLEVDIRDRLHKSKMRARHRRGARLCICLLVAALGLPWVGMSSVLLLHALYGVVMYYLMLSVVVSYCDYGPELEEQALLSRSQANVPSLESVIPTVEEGVADAGENLAATSLQRVEEAVLAWVESREYSNPNISIEQALQSMGIQDKALYYYFDCKGIPSYRNWISTLRIEESKRQLLAHPNYSIDAIAGLCGFSSGSSLSRAFRTSTGYTPSQWVKRQEENQNHKVTSNKA